MAEEPAKPRLPFPTPYPHNTNAFLCGGSEF